MKTTHTTGEWNFSKTVNDYAIYSDKNPNFDIASVYEYSRAIPQEEAEANARLIAAAPTMLKTLEEILEFSPDALPNHVIKIVEEAIRKATF